MFQGVSIRAAVFSVFPDETRAICTFLLAHRLDAQPPADVPDDDDMHAFLRVISLRKYDATEIVPILTRADTLGPRHANDVIRSLNWPVPAHKLISDGRATAPATSGKLYCARDRTCLLSQQIDQSPTR